MTALRDPQRTTRHLRAMRAVSLAAVRMRLLTAAERRWLHFALGMAIEWEASLADANHGDAATGDCRRTVRRCRANIRRFRRLQAALAAASKEAGHGEAGGPLRRP